MIKGGTFVKVPPLTPLKLPYMGFIKGFVDRDIINSAFPVILSGV
jgi:hypothetical protein